MLQIIGWILCLYLVVKACELLSMKTNEHKYAAAVGAIGAVIALVGAGIFFLLINEQVRASNEAQERMNSAISNLTP